MAIIGAKLTSLIWRSLTFYGRIKYRYLLPIYRRLGLMPGGRALVGKGLSGRTLRIARSVVSLINRGGDRVYLHQLSEILKRVQSSKGAVIFLPSTGWALINTQRAHHLAREFARQGYVSIFDCSNAYDDVNGFKEVEQNLFLFRGDEGLLSQVPDPILWTLTYNFHRTDAYPCPIATVYDWIDDLEIFPYPRDFLDSNHVRALKEASLVVSVSHRLHEKAVALRPDALYLPNGVEYDHFALGQAATPKDRYLDSFLQKERPIAGYFGAFAEWFDYELLYSIARLRPDWNFLLIGPKLDLSLDRRGGPMLGLPNVLWLGSRAYESLPGYLQLFDVGMIPFVINNVTLATSPIKMYEYFAGGKPVILTWMPECRAMPGTHIVRDVQEFSRALDSALLEGRDKNAVERLRKLAQANTWSERVRAALGTLEKSRKVKSGEAAIR